MLELFINEGVIEPGAGGIGSGGSVKDAGGARPIDCTQAHGAGFAGAIEITTGELKIVKNMAGFADGDDFGVGGGVICGGNAIRALGDHPAVLDDERRERATATGANIFDGERDGTAHEISGSEGSRHRF